VSGNHGEQGGEQDDAVAYTLQPHRQPPVGHDAGVIGLLVLVHLQVTLADEAFLLLEARMTLTPSKVSLKWE